MTNINRIPKIDRIRNHGTHTDDAIVHDSNSGTMHCGLCALDRRIISTDAMGRIWRTGHQVHVETIQEATEQDMGTVCDDCKVELS